MSRQKTKRHRTVKKSPRRNATKPAPQTSDKTKIALLTRELSEALEQQTVTCEVLGVISRSADRKRIVLERRVENAVRRSSAERSVVVGQDGGVDRRAAR